MTYELVEVYKKVEQLKKEVDLWKKASENNSYKAFQFEKENTELKEQNRNYEQLIDTGSVTLAKERLKNYKHLTKAKEIIKEFMRISVASVEEYEPEFSELIGKAEQFLQEVEK